MAPGRMATTTQQRAATILQRHSTIELWTTAQQRRSTTQVRTSTIQKTNINDTTVVDSTRIIITTIDDSSNSTSTATMSNNSTINAYGNWLNIWIDTPRTCCKQFDNLRRTSSIRFIICLPQTSLIDMAINGNIINITTMPDAPVNDHEEADQSPNESV